MSEIIKVENLIFAYGAAPPVLLNVTFSVPEGDFLAIAGPNGAGKTTLLNLLCGLLKSDKGGITLERRNVNSYSTKKLARKIAVVRQEASPVFEYTVAELVSMGRTPHLGLFGFEGPADHNLAEHAMEVTDTMRFASRPVAKLSGGERQRVSIARALAQDCPVLLLDEPTSFLDLKHQVKIYDLLKKMQVENGKTIVAVTHDLNLAAQYCDSVLLLSTDGTFQHGSTREVLSPANVEKVFSVRAFSASLGRENFIMPLGNYAKDARLTTQQNSRED